MSINWLMDNKQGDKNGMTLSKQKQTTDATMEKESHSSKKPDTEDYCRHNSIHIKSQKCQNYGDKK